MKDKSKALKDLLQADLNFVNKIALPVTVRKVKDVYQESTKKLIRNFVAKEFNQYMQNNVYATVKCR